MVPKANFREEGNERAQFCLNFFLVVFHEGRNNGGSLLRDMTVPFSAGISWGLDAWSGWRGWSTVGPRRFLLRAPIIPYRVAKVNHPGYLGKWLSFI